MTAILAEFEAVCAKVAILASHTSSEALDLWTFLVCQTGSFFSQEYFAEIYVLR